MSLGLGRLRVAVIRRRVHHEDLLSFLENPQARLIRAGRDSNRLTHRAQQIRQIPRLGKLGCRGQQDVGKAVVLTFVAVASISRGSYSTTIPVL